MRQGSFFWGFFITSIGCVLLLNQLFPQIQLGKFLFAFMLIFLGLWFLAAPYLHKGELPIENLTLPRENLNQASIYLKHGAGKLNIKEMSPNSHDILSGAFYGGVIQNIRHNNGQLLVELETPHINFWNLPPHVNKEGLNWNINLNREVEIDLQIEGGANEVHVDLSELIIKNLKMSVGANSNQILLPAHAGFTNVMITSGAASVNIKVPSGVSARIQPKMGLSSIHIDEQRFPSSGEIYESLDYNYARNRVFIVIETGVGSVDIR